MLGGVKNSVISHFFYCITPSRATLFKELELVSSLSLLHTHTDFRELMGWHWHQTLQVFTYLISVMF